MHKKITKIMTVFLLTVTSGLFAFGASAEPEATAAEPASLYERLGAWDGISKVVADTIALHVKNPTISHYFKDTDLDKLHEHVTAFFAAGTGGPAKYEGRDMTSAHAAMGMSDEDFQSAVADVLTAVKMNGLGEQEQADVEAILMSLKPAVMGTGGS
jgi:hemoglobin